MKKRVSKRRLYYVVTYAAALSSVATVPWSLLVWRHVLINWGTDFDWVPRLLFVLLAGCSVGLMFICNRYIEENALYLYRHESAMLNLASMFALPVVAAGAMYVSVQTLSVTFMAYLLHPLLALVFELYCFFQMVNLYDRPVRPAPEKADKAPANPFLLFSMVVLVPTIWVSATYACGYLPLAQAHPVLPYLASTVLVLLLVGIVRALFVEAPLTPKKTRRPIPLAPTPPAEPPTAATPPHFSPKTVERRTTTANRP